MARRLLTPGHPRGPTALVAGAIMAVVAATAIIVWSGLQVRVQYLRECPGSGSGGADAASRTCSTTATAANAAGVSRGSPTLGNRSARWAPLVLSECAEGMPRHWAPCLVGGAADPSLVYAEEVVYPDFSIPEPGFLNENDAVWWRQQAANFAPERYWLRDGRGYYLAQHGQNLVLRNVQFQNDPPTDDWGERSCMAVRVDHRALAPLALGSMPTARGRVVLANTPDSWSFQHFTDRVASLLVQTEAWRGPGTHILTGREPRDAHVSDFWDMLLPKGGRQLVVHGVHDFAAEELVFPCRCPLMHPFLAERLREMMPSVPAPAPPHQRKVVLYFSRNPSDDFSRIGASTRQVTNEAEVLKAIERVLEQRGKGEQLVMFNEAEYPHAQGLAAYMAAHVAAMVGPHGGALYNGVWWLPPGSLVLEFLPKSRFQTLFWEECSMRAQRYWVMPAESSPENGHSMRLDPAAVAQVLRERLDPPPSPQAAGAGGGGGEAADGGAEAAYGPRPHYNWDLAQLLGPR